MKQQERKPLIILTGPTSCRENKSFYRTGQKENIGWGGLSSADSMPVYKKMDIGTAKDSSGRNARSTTLSD